MNSLSKMQERAREEFTRRTVDYFDDGSKKPDLKVFYECLNVIDSLIALTREEVLKEAGEFAERMKLDELTPSDAWRDGYNNALGSFSASLAHLSSLREDKTL